MFGALCLPWETITAYYYPGQYSQMVWSPLEFLWNIVASQFPGASDVISWVTGGMWPFAVAFALYLVCALFIVRHTPRLLRGDQLPASLDIALLMADSCAGFLALLGWVLLPYIYLLRDSGPSMYPTEGLIGPWLLTFSSVLSFAGVALVGIALLRIATPARSQPAEG